MPASHRQLKKRTRNRFDFSKVSKNFSIQPFFRAIKKNQVDWKNQMYKDRIKLVNIVNCTTTFLQKPVTISKHVWIKLLLFASVGEYRVTLVRNKKKKLFFCRIFIRLLLRLQYVETVLEENICFLCSFF